MLNLNIVVYLMLLSGILFLGLSVVAKGIINPGPKGSKKSGYIFILTAFLLLCVQQEYRSLVQLGFAEERIWKILAGLIIPVFFLNLVYYRYRKRSLAEKE